MIIIGTYQKFRGNPEQKLFYLLNNFVGGINTEFSDDNSNDVDFENIINFEMDKLGTLSKRGGFGELSAISEIFNKLDLTDDLPVVFNRTEEEPNPENTNDNIVYMKLLRNDNNCFRALSGFSGENAYRKYQEMYGFQDNKFVLLLITTKFAEDSEESNTSTAWLYQCELPELEYEDGEITDTDTMTITCNKITLPVVFDWDRNLMNIPTIEFYDKIYFTDNDKGLVTFDRSVPINSDTDFADAFTYSGSGMGADNNAYTPSGLEIRHVGFNVLQSDPMHAIDTQGISTDSVQGIFICTTDNIPLQSLPLGQKFLLNIIYTGNDNGFTVEMKEGENTISFDLLANSTLSRAGLKVYEVTLKDPPNNEVEIKITKTGATLEPYYDYYNVSQIDAEAKPITALNVGNYGICEMYNRAVFYKDDTVWFSEVNNFKYIPNYNYVTLPIEPTDKITKIAYFKKAYIIFTKQRIYKMTGSFGTNNFSVSPVNMSLGCHAGNTVMPIEDTLYFASPRGLYTLKSNTFLEGYENVKELDLKVKKLTSDFTKYSEELNEPAIRFNGISEKAYALRYKDKYLLFYNNYDDKGDYAAVNGLDVLAYQFDIGAYTTYRFKEKPTFLFMVDNAMETISIQKEKEIYVDEEVLFNYDFDNSGVEDLSDNHNDAVIRGNLPINKGVGLSFTYPLSSSVRINHFETYDDTQETNLKQGFNIYIDTKFSTLGSGGAVLYNFSTNSRVVPTIKDSIEINLERFSSVYTLQLDYTITPNTETLNDTVSYQLKLINKSSTVAGISYIHYTLGPNLIDFTSDSTISLTAGEQVLLNNGVFTISRNSDGTYSNTWSASVNANINGRAMNSSKNKNVQLSRVYKSFNNIRLSQYNDNDQLLFEINSGYGNFSLLTPNNIGLTNRRIWEVQIVKSGENYTCNIVENGSIISTGTIPGAIIVNLNRDDCFLGSRFLGNMYKFKIYNSSRSLLEYDFDEGKGTQLIDKSGMETPATINNCTWLIQNGISFEGYGYLELPAFRDIYFSNGFKIEFEGTIGNNNDLVKILDLATENSTNNSSISISTRNNMIEFSTLSLSHKTYKISSSNIDLTQKHKFIIDCVDNGNGYTLTLKIDNITVNEQEFKYGGIDNLTRVYNYIGKSNTNGEPYFKGLLNNFKFIVYANLSPIPLYKISLYEFDTTPTDFGKPIYLELKTKGINMGYPQHLKKLKHIFVKAIGGYNYGELFFTLYGDGYIVNDPKIYSYYIDEEGTVVQDYEYVKNLTIDERISLLGNMRLDRTKLGEGTYQTRKLVIPKKCKNFTLEIYGESNDYISLESFGFVVKLGKVKEG